MDRLGFSYSRTAYVTPATGSMCGAYSPPIAPRSALPEGFDGVDQAEVRAQFESNPEFLTILADALAPIRTEFGPEARVSLETVPEYSGEHTLYATILASGSDEDLDARFERFKHSWWFDRVRLLRGHVALAVARA